MSFAKARDVDSMHRLISVTGLTLLIRAYSGISPFCICFVYFPKCFLVALVTNRRDFLLSC